MITGTSVWLAIEPIDLRVGIDRLSLCMQQTLGRRPTDGNLYAFRNRRGNRLTSALLDRLLHHVESVVIEGPSYRMREINDT